jgi:tetratricopeptide (TPR) repeat protein
VKGGDMSEVEKLPGKSKKTRTIIFVAVISVLILLLVYGAGTIVLPISILSSYHDKNCDSVSSLNGMYTSIYPGFIRDETVDEPVEECANYALGVSKQQDENWQAAYDAFQAYSKAYPNGIYARDAYDQSAVVLLELAEDHVAQKDYADALTNLNLIISTYSDSSTYKDALTLVPSTYTLWGTDLRDAESFDIAERVFNDFRLWTQNNQKPEIETEALDELAQTYLTWGLTLQSRQEYDAALIKYDMASNLDPKLSPDTVADAKSHQRKLYIEWGNDLLEQDQFSAAIETLKLGVSRADGNDEDGVSEALINGYIQWANKYVEDDDFEGSLDQLTIAERAAISDELKKTVDEARGNTYLAFSISDGIQAQRAIRAALISVCDRNKKPDLPIFGLNEDVVRFGIYGVDTKLPDDAAAQTPGELHYIACVEEGSNNIESRTYRDIVLRTSTGYYYRDVTQYRAELLWYINLLKIDTLEDMDEKTFVGGTPAPFENSGGTYFYGPPPDMAEVVKWLQSVIK